jgi:acyl-CoA thioester hydrolase
MSEPKLEPAWNLDATVCKIRVRYGETDQMGHAYYANYLYWFEEARGAWCRDRGFAYKDWEEAGFKLPVVEVFARYRREIKYDDLVCIEVRLAQVGRSSLKFEYRLYVEGAEEIATEGYTWHVLLGDTGRPTRFPVELMENLNRKPIC